MSKRISRRAWLTSVPALGGLLLTGCSRETFVPPRVRGGLIGAADVLTMSTNRLLLSGQQLAREYPPKRDRRPVPDLEPDQPAERGVSTPRVGRVQELAPADHRPGRASARVVARRDQKPACPHADHRPRVRTGLVGDRRVDGRAAPAGARSGWRRHAGRALRRHRHLRWVVRGIRSVRGRASADDPCLRPQRSRPSERQRRAAPSPRRTAVRIQEPQVPEIDSGRRLDGRHRQGHRWNQLGLRVPLVRRRLEALPLRVWRCGVALTTAGAASTSTSFSTAARSAAEVRLQEMRQRLRSTTGPVEVLVINRVERASPN